MNLLLVLNFLIYSTLFVIIISLTLNPIIFWIYVIPKIEERGGHKLKFHPQYDFIPLGKFFIAPIELGYTISLMYLSLKIFKDKTKIKFDKNRALVIVKYDIETASRSELVISLISFSCLVLFGVQLLLMFLIPITYPLH